MNKELLTSVLYRFARGFVAGFIGSGILVIPTNIDSFQGLKDWFVAMGVMAVIGAISGGLQALDKMFRELGLYGQSK